MAHKSVIEEAQIYESMFNTYKVTSKVDEISEHLYEVENTIYKLKKKYGSGYLICKFGKW